MWRMQKRYSNCMQTIRTQAETVRNAQKELAGLTDDQKRHILLALCDQLEADRHQIFTANRKDVEAAEREGVAKPLVKRLKFDEAKLHDCVLGIRDVASLEDPTGKVLLRRELDEGLILVKESCPIGVIGMIFESRPDALVQIVSLCLKSGNGIILKGGSEAALTNRALAESIARAVSSCGMNPQWMCLLETREEVSRMLELDDLIDLLIPRGSNQFVRWIMDHSRIPVLGHADGICHVYVDRDADLDRALHICVDAKCQYPAACNAAETFLVHEAAAPSFLPMLASALQENQVEIRGDKAVRSVITCEPAAEEDWGTEYLDLTVSVKVVASLDEAVSHIHTYGSGHTDAVITECRETAEEFLDRVDSAGVYWNCSTRFADGYRYGLGAEVGISTHKIHARGPVGLEGLVSYKWKLYGSGQAVSDYSGEHGRRFTHRDLSP